MAGRDDKKQPIVVKKIKKGEHGHHGGAWKVAYADFVTAMMAFFLLMWLLGSTSEGQKAGISDFFQSPSAVQGAGGSSTSLIKLGGALDVPRGEEGDPVSEVATSADEEAEEQEDKARLDKLMQEIREQIEESPSLQSFKDQLLIDITTEGLRIQIVDKENRPMFDLGATKLKPYTQAILREMGKTIDSVPNHVSITGHTDATPYAAARRDYSNWELSAERANTARREMIGGGLNEGKVGRVVGLASSVMFDRANPYNPINRRISIIVLNRATERAIGLDHNEDGNAPQAPANGQVPPPTPAARPGPAAKPINEVDIKKTEQQLREVLGR